MLFSWMPVLGLFGYLKYCTCQAHLLLKTKFRSSKHFMCWSCEWRNVAPLQEFWPELESFLPRVAGNSYLCFPECSATRCQNIFLTTKNTEHIFHHLCLIFAEEKLPHWNQMHFLKVHNRRDSAAILQSALSLSSSDLSFTKKSISQTCKAFTHWAPDSLVPTVNTIGILMET